MARTVVILLDTLSNKLWSVCICANTYLMTAVSRRLFDWHGPTAVELAVYLSVCLYEYFLSFSFNNNNNNNANNF